PRSFRTSVHASWIAFADAAVAATVDGAPRSPAEVVESGDDTVGWLGLGGTTPPGLAAVPWVPPRPDGDLATPPPGPSAGALAPCIAAPSAEVITWSALIPTTPRAAQTIVAAMATWNSRCI